MHLSLFQRLALSLTLLLCAALLTLGYLSLKNADARFHEERLALAHAQVRTLADGSLDALVTRDYELLERWVSSVLPARYYAYAYLARADGLVLIHTDHSRIAQRLDALGELQGSLQRTRSVDDRRVQEVAYPARVADQHLANAVVGYYIDDTHLLTRESTLQILLALGLFLALLLVATLIIIRRYTRPLADLTHTITATSLSAASVRLPDAELLQRHDEVGALAREYHNLMLRLQQSWAELRDEEQRLRDMVDVRTRDLRDSNRELEAFSYSVSHDLRAPLRGINGFSQLLLDDYEDRLDADGRDYLHRIRTASRKMAQLIDDLLQLSRVGRTKPQWKDINLSELALESYTRLRDAEPQRKVSFEVTPDLHARGDPGLLGVLLDNLVGNAWKYSGKHPRAEISFGSRQQDGETVYFVRDNGVGFDMAHAGNLFGPFQRLHNDSEFEGTGIGLATVQRIVQLHHGRVWAEAESGRGATFYFTLGKPQA